MDPKKIENITLMDGANRYSYFVRKVADTEVLWGLYDNGWAAAATDIGDRAIPFWPESEFAALSATDKWSGYEPKSIDLNLFLERWIPGMTEDGVKAAVFPTLQEQAVFVAAEEVGDALSEEAEQYS